MPSFFRNDSRTRTAYILITVALVLNAVIFVLKYYSGLASNSISMKASAWLTLSTSVSSIIILIGFWLHSNFQKEVTNDKYDKHYLFDKGGVESIGIIVITIMIALVGTYYLLESIIGIGNFEYAMFTVFSFKIFLLSSISKELYAQVLFFYGRKINSKSLVSMGNFHRYDIISSFFISTIAFLHSLPWWLDGAYGLIIAFLLLLNAYLMFDGSVKKLLGTALPQDILPMIYSLSKQKCPELLSLYGAKMKSLGEYKEVSFFIAFPNEMTVEDARSAAKEIENELKNSYSIDAKAIIQ